MSKLATAETQKMALMATVSRLLREKDWNFRAHDGVIEMSVGSDSHQFPVRIQVREDTSLLVGMLTYTRKCPPEYRDNMVRFMNRTNFDFSMGGFEMDRSDGEVKYRSAIDVESLDLTATFINNFLRTVAMLGCKYADAVTTIMDGKPVEAALRKV